MYDFYNERGQLYQLTLTMETVYDEILLRVMRERVLKDEKYKTERFILKVIRERVLADERHKTEDENDV